MAAINHTHSSQLTNQTTTSTTFGDVTGAIIADTFFTAGKKYLLVISLNHRHSASEGVSRVRVIHGSTAFDDSEVTQACSFTGAEWNSYFWFDVWTAVSSEAIKVQFANDIASGTVSADQISMVAINLSDDLVENTDWHSAVDAADVVLSGTHDGASITFTPGTAGHDWLVMSMAQGTTSVSGTASDHQTALIRSGEAASSLPSSIFRAYNTSGYANQDRKILYGIRAFNLGAASNTFKEQSSFGIAASNDTRLHSKVFALNLNKFKNHAVAYTEADLALAVTSFGNELQTASITPDVQGDVWFGGFFNYDCSDAQRRCHYRIQVDNADVPAGQTTDNYLFGQSWANPDEVPHCIQWLSEFTAAAHTIDLDGDCNVTTSTPAAEERQIWAVTMELDAAAGGQAPRTMQQMRMRRR